MHEYMCVSGIDFRIFFKGAGFFSPMNLGVECGGCVISYKVLRMGESITKGSAPIHLQPLLRKN